MTFEVVINESAFEQSVTRQVAPVMQQKLGEVKTFIIEEFNAPKSGREYRRRRGTHRASAPGEPPAIDTGTLLASIGEPHVRKEGNALVGTLTISASYAGLLERGTPRMAARPFAMPAVEEILRRRA